MRVMFALGIVAALSAAVQADMPATQPSLSSKPAVKEGLSVTVTLSKAVVAVDEPLKFVVRFKNVSEKPFSLYDADWCWDWTMQFADVKAGGPWKLRMLVAAARLGGSVKPLQAGEALEVPVELDNGGGQFDFVWEGDQKKPVAPIGHLAPGKYALTVAITLKASPADRALTWRYWTGTIASNPIEFEIAEKGGGAAPPQTQPAAQAGPVTEAQAKELAAKFAEAARQNWGQPAGISKHADGYWVVFDTPQREVEDLGQRTIIVNAATGKCRFQPRE